MARVLYMAPPSVQSTFERIRYQDRIRQLERERADLLQDAIRRQQADESGETTAVGELATAAVIATRQEDESADETPGLEGALAEQASTGDEVPALHLGLGHVSVMASNR